MADYIDLDYSMAMNSYGDIDLKEDAEAVKQSMLDILLTKVGEREFMPLYGSKLHWLLFQKVSNLTKLDIQEEIKSSLQNWEPRIQLTGVLVESFPDSNYYEVTINFDLIRLQQSETLNLQLKRIG